MSTKKLATRGHVVVLDEGETAVVATLGDAAEKVQMFVDSSGMGASEMCAGFGNVIAPDGSIVARVSYNGRVWPPKKWEPGDPAIEGNILDRPLN